jgi:hypothetical protein
MTGDWNPVVAFEHLAALSTVARWVSEWDLVEYIPPLDLTPIDPAKIHVIRASQQVQKSSPPPAR